MALRPENLPRDPALLAELALALDAENESLRATIANLKGLIFGARSERMAAILAEQLALDLQDLADDVTPAAANDDAPSSPTTNSRGSRPKPKRNIGALPKKSPRRQVIVETGDHDLSVLRLVELHRIGEDVSEALDVEPAILRVLRTIRPKYACRACEEVVVQAKAPARLIEGGMVTTALVVHIAVAKYGWQSTLYRQMQILAGPRRPARSVDAGEMDEAGRMDAQSPLSSSTRSHARLPASVLRRDADAGARSGRKRTKVCQFWTPRDWDDRPWLGPAPPAVAYVFAES